MMRVQASGGVSVFTSSGCGIGPVDPPTAESSAAGPAVTLDEGGLVGAEALKPPRPRPLPLPLGEPRGKAPRPLPEVGEVGGEAAFAGEPKSSSLDSSSLSVVAGFCMDFFPPTGLPESHSRLCILSIFRLAFCSRARSMFSCSCRRCACLTRSVASVCLKASSSACTSCRSGVSRDAGGSVGPNTPACVV